MDATRRHGWRVAVDVHVQYCCNRMLHVCGRSTGEQVAGRAYFFILRLCVLNEKIDGGYSMSIAIWCELVMGKANPVCQFDHKVGINMDVPVHRPNSSNWQ